MKAIFIAIVLLFVSTTEAQYRENKKKFDYKSYSYQAGDRYNPTLAGAASFLWPGLGQIIVGETGRGLAFMGGSIVSAIIFAKGLIQFDDSIITYSIYDTNAVNSYRGRDLIWIGLIGTIGITFWSMGDAVRVAKVNNLASREIDKKVSFSLHPIVLPQTNSKHLAGGLQLNIQLN